MFITIFGTIAMIQLQSNIVLNHSLRTMHSTQAWIQTAGLQQKPLWLFFKLCIVVNTS